MWLQLNDQQVAIVKALLEQRIAQATIGRATSIEVVEHVNILNGIRGRTPAIYDNDPFRDYLKSQADDEMEVDDDAIVSAGSDPGSWVHAWIWVTNEQAGIFVCDECNGEFSLDRRGSGDCDVCDECYRADDDEPERCDSCNEPLDEAGDGWDGKCADCADKAAQCENCGNTDNDGSDICPDCKGAMTS